MAAFSMYKNKFLFAKALMKWNAFDLGHLINNVTFYHHTPSTEFHLKKINEYRSF